MLHAPASDKSGDPTFTGRVFVARLRVGFLVFRVLSRSVTLNRFGGHSGDGPCTERNTTMADSTASIDTATAGETNTATDVAGKDGVQFEAITSQEELDRIITNRLGA